MKKQLVYGLMISAGAAFMTGCSDDFNPGGSTTGKINPIVGLDTEAVNALPATSRAQAAVISVDDLKLKLIPDDETMSPSVWESVGHFNSNEEFKVGSYTLEAYYGDASEEGFDKPHYYGSTKLTVRENEVTNVSLPVALANSMVLVKTTDAFDGYFTEASFALKSTGSTNEIAYPAGSEKAAYMKPGDITVYADVTKPNGKSARLEAATFKAEAKCHYTVSVDVNEGQVGAASMVITFSDDLDGTETVEIELSDELFAIPGPTVDLTGYDTNSTYNFIAGALPEGLSPMLMIKAQGGIKSIMMTSQSDWLASKGIANELDLVAMPDNTYAQLKALGMTGEYHRVDKLARINLTELLRNIAYMPDSESNESGFAFIVTDKSGKVSEPVVIKVTVNNVEGHIVSTGGIGEGGSELDVTVSYNGDNFERDVAIQFRNERGTWSNAAYTIVNTSRSSELKDYDLHLTGLPTTGNLELRLMLCGTNAGTTNVERADIEMSFDERDIFATHAIVTLASGSMDLSGDNNVVVTPAGATVTRSGNDYILENLTPGTNYKVSATVDGITVNTKFTTEAATQLANNGMEEWLPRTDGLTKYWWTEYPGGNWSSLNQLTTSQGGNSTSMVSHNGCSYNAYSGTRETNDAYSGSKAAIIETVGWGRGNSAAVFSGRMGTCQNVTAGELFLGTYNNGANYGISFGSRPASLSFYYKYTAKNSADYGVAEIKILDVSGNLIASKTENLTATGNYEQRTLTLDYPAKAAKCASIQVLFKSSGNDVNSQKNTNWLTPPPGADLSDGRYTGSSLWIDDVTLNY